MKYYTIALICSTLISLPLIAQKSSEESTDQLRIVAVNPTPEPETVVTVVQLPRDGDVLKGNPVWVQLRLDGYALGNHSSFDRADEIVNSDKGQTIHVIVDDHPYFAVNGPSIQPFNEDGFYYNQNYKFELPFKLKDGFHTIRVFPARSYGESLKGSRTYQASYFYINQEGNSEQVDILSRPYLTYNEPSDQIHFVEGQPVLFDFYLTNCELSPDGYKVRLTVDGKVKRTISTWKPYYIYGLKKGKHTFRLELIDEKNKVVPGPYNDVQRSIVVH